MTQILLQLAGLPVTNRTMMLAAVVVGLLFLVVTVVSLYYLKRLTEAVERIAAIGEQAAAEGEED